MSKKYLALLRGINVSGKNPIKMKEFQAHLQDEKFEKVKTYIQSGNIIFDCKIAGNEMIAKRVSEVIKDKYGYDVPVIVLVASELEKLIKNNPFENEAADEPNEVMFSFLSDIPGANLVQKFELSEYKTEKFKIFEKQVFLYCMNGIGKAKISTNYLESKLNVIATTRNWKTILKLHEMMKEN